MKIGGSPADGLIDAKSKVDDPRLTLAIAEFRVALDFASEFFTKKFPNNPDIVNLFRNTISNAAETVALRNILIQKGLLTDRQFMEQANEEVKYLIAMLGRGL